MRNWFGTLARLPAHQPPPRTAVDVAQLEDRVMLSAGPMVAGAVDLNEAAGLPQSPEQMAPADAQHAVDPGGSHQDAGEFRFSDAESHAEQRQGDAAEQAARLELIFVDRSVSNYQQLIDDVLAAGDSTRELEVHLLNTSADGIEQITEVLAGYDHVDAVHLVSHGAEGAVKLGNTWLRADNLAGYAGDVARWKLALADDADLLIYGCDLAAGDEGRTLVEALAALTGTDVAASTDNTGHALFGADWELEFAAGEVETPVAVSRALQQDWIGLLDPVTLAATNELPVNSTTADAQQTTAEARGSLQAVAADAAGNYVVVWSSLNQDGSGYGVYGQRFSPSGAAVGSEFRVNEFTTNDQKWATVAMAPTGEFVVTWTSENQAGLTSSIFARQFQADGTPAGSEFRVNTTTSGTHRNSMVATDDQGDFVVVWECDDTTDYVYGQRYDKDGNTQGGQFTVASGFLVEPDPSIGMAGDGRFAIAWENLGDIKVQRYDASGIAQGAVITASDGLGTISDRATVGMADDGSFVVVWTDRPLLQTAEIEGQRYDALGNPLGGQFIVNQTTANDQGSPSIALDAAGNFTVVWEGEGLGDTAGVFSRTYDAAGNPTTGEVRVNQTTSGNQHLASAAMFDPDNFIVVWSGEGPSDNSGVFVRQFGSAPANAALWLSTEEDVSSPSGAPGLDSWSEGTVLRFADPNLEFDPAAGNTDGTFGAIVNFDALGDDGNVGIDAMHYVTRAMTIGGAHAIALQPGDLLLSTGDDEDFTSGNALSVNKEDLFLFRPDVAGDYSSGTFTLVLEGNDPSLNIGDLWAVTLVEQNTRVGDTDLSAGDFLFSRQGGSEDNDVYWFRTADVGLGSTDGSAVVLIEGDKIDIAEKIYGLELIEQNVTLGGVTLTTGQLLVTLENSDGNVGDNGIPTARQDVFILDVSQTTFTPNPAAATATLLFDGSDVGLDSNDENIDALTLIPVASGNNAPTITSNGAGATAAINIVENTTAVTTVNATDADLPAQTLTYSISGGLDAARFAIDSSTGVLTLVAAPDFESPIDAGSNNVYDVTVRVSDGSLTDTQAISVTVTDSTVLDQFNAVSYAGNDGPRNWSAPWEELGETTDPAAGRVRVTGGRLRLGGDEVSLSGRGLYREADLGGATTATLSFNYQRQRLDESGGSVTVAISSNGGSTWSNLKTYNLSGTDASPIHEEFDVSAFISGNVQVRFLGSGSEVSSYFFVDDVQISDGVATNASPVITSDGGGPTAAVNVVENTLAVTTVTAFDPDGQTPTFSISGGDDAARFSINPTSGSLTFITAPDYESPADFDSDNVYQVEVQADDGVGGIGTQLIDVTVTPANETPTADAGGPYTINEGDGLTLDASGSADPDADPLSYRWDLDNDGTFGDATGVSPTLSWAQLVAFGIDDDGSHAIRVEVDDGAGGVDTASTAITVTNTAPTAIDDSGAGFTTDEDTPLTTGNVLVGDSDPSPGDPLSVAGIDTTGTLGLVTNNGDGTFDYDPNGQFDALRPGQQASDSFSYTVSDGDGGFDTATVTVTINGRNDTPTADAGGPYAVSEGSGVTLDASGSSDPDADPLTYSWDLDNDGTFGDATGISPTLSWAQLVSFGINDDGTYTIRVEVNDGNGGVGTATATLAVINLAPSILSPLTASVEENTTFVQTVTATDPVDTLTFSLSGGADRTAFMIHPTTGVLSFSAPPNFEAPADADTDNVYEVMVRVDDGDGGSGEQLVRVAVSDANDAPKGADDSYSVDADQTLVAAGPGVLAGDADEDADPLAVSLVGGPAHGSLTLSPDGSFTYTPQANYSGIDSFTYRISDGRGGSDTATVSIQVGAIGGAVATPVVEPPPAVEEPAPEESAEETESPALPGAAGPDAAPSGNPAPDRTSTERGSDSTAGAASVAAVPNVATDPIEQAAYSGDAGTASAKTVSGSVRQLLRGPAAGAVERFVAAFDVGMLDSDLCDMKKDMDESTDVPIIAAGSAVGATTTLTVGYVLWTIRSGWLATTLMAQMPAWRMIDPLAVLDCFDDEEEGTSGDDDSLESLLEDEHPGPEEPVPDTEQPDTVQRP